MKGGLTSRGFVRYDFVDRYGEKCSLQESSLADEEAIWLGCDHETMTRDGARAGARMHLTREMAAELLPMLQHFIDTGRLPAPVEENAGK